MKYYTGIGSRDTPEHVLDEMTQLAREFVKRGWTLRSGGAQGADTAFEKDAMFFKEIYLPWKGFNGNGSELFESSEEAFELAARSHPAWHRCSEGARKIHARNVHQVLGRDLKTPSSVVVCWTRGGRFIGGTAQALRIAKSWHIPIFNLGDTGLIALRSYLES